jgi:hypothetical protein
MRCNILLFALLAYSSGRRALCRGGKQLCGIRTVRARVERGSGSRPGAFLFTAGEAAR